MPTEKVSLGKVRFGVFEADLRAGELHRNGVKVRIQELPFRALTLLLKRSGEVITREELRQALWSEGVFVDFDRGISSAIRRLREALGDSAENPIFIETIERRGYRWIAPVHKPEVAISSPLEDPKGLPAQTTPVQATNPWRKMIFAFPALALLFAVWIFRPGYRDAKAGTVVPAVRPSTLHHAANREAEDFYLKGRYYWNKRTPETLNQAIDFFTQAIVRDPNYSDAYVGLADCYNLLREYSAMPSTEAYPRAFAAAKKAVELDDRSSQAHASLAFASFFGMWDTGTADQEFRRALELDPNNAIAHHWYATYLHSVRRSGEALNEIERAQALDPNSSSILADKGILLWHAGRREEALRLLRQLAAADPDFVSPHRYLRMIYFETGDDSSYLSELKKEAQELQNPVMLAIQEAAEKGFKSRGSAGMLQAQLNEQKKFHSQGKYEPYFVAQTCSRLGYTQDALKYLELSFQQRDEDYIMLAVDPAFDNLHSNPSFPIFLARGGLPPLP